MNGPRHWLLLVVALGTGIGPSALTGATPVSADAGGAVSVHTMPAPTRAPATRPRVAAAGPICAPSCTPPLVSHSTNVEAHPRLYLVFWGPRWNSDTSGVQATVTSMANALHGTAYNQLLLQYGVSDDVTLAGTWVDPQGPTVRVTPKTLFAEADQALAQNSTWTNDANTNFIILPQVFSIIAPTKTQIDFCGYHTRGPSQQGNGTIVATLIPYLSNTPFGTSLHCLNYGSGSLVDAMTTVTAHEYAETATDPLIDNWYTANPGHTYEIGDLCAYAGTTVAGIPAAVQLEWDNATGQCQPASSLDNLVTRASMATRGAQANGQSLVASASADGSIIAFASDACNLLGMTIEDPPQCQDQNGTRDIFIRNLRSGTVTMAYTPIPRDTTPGDCPMSSATWYPCAGPSDVPSMSGDGSLVVFASTATNLITNVYGPHIYLAHAGQVTDLTGSLSYPNGPAVAVGNPVISTDGSTVAYLAEVPSPRGGYMWEGYSGPTGGTATPVTPHGVVPDRGMTGIALSANGRSVFFASSSSNVLTKPRPIADEIYRFTPATGAVQLVSKTSGGAPASATSNGGGPASNVLSSISGNGRYMVWTTNSINLPGTGVYSNVVVRDLKTGVTTAVASDALGGFVSGDGTAITYTQTGWLSSCGCPTDDVYVKLGTGGTPLLVSRSLYSGGQANSASVALGVSSTASSGIHVLFRSGATDLVTGDTNGVVDIFSAQG